jgi:Fe2+ or Zn2+ uptake regulation protein
MSLLNTLLDEKITKILLVLYRDKNQFYHITNLSAAANVPAATTFRLLKILTKSGAVSMSKVGKFKIYKYNETEQNNNLMGLLEK